jgi:branched-chain amino acid transport system substrate-binding protein
VSINRKKFGALLCIAAIGIVVAATAGAARQSTPGVTKNSITIGGTFPLTGGASLYATIAGAEQAYYGWINAHGGVNHRKINDIVKDDQYDPSQTVPADKDLVENKHVFAIVGSLGTAPGLATMNYLNGKGVPQVLLATGDAYWGQCSEHGKAFKPIAGVCTKPKPWTEGWQPDYPGEAQFYAKYVLAHPPSGAAKIGILYQNDAYGLNYRDSFVKALGSHKSDIVDQEAYNFGDSAQVVGGHVGALEAHGANTVLLFSTPTASVQALATMGGVLHWSPLTLLNNVSANRVFLLAAEQNGATPAGVLSSTYIKSQTVTPKDAAMKLAKQIIYATKDSGLKHQFDIGDSNLVYGLAVAWTFVDALKHAGKTPTRASLMHALRTLNESGKNKNPFVYPGMSVKTSSKNTFPMQQLQLQKWNGSTHDWKTIGGVFTSGH